MENQKSTRLTDGDEARTGRQPLDKKPYARPVLVEWGTVTQLTKGTSGGTQDSAFSGTGT